MDTFEAIEKRRSIKNYDTEFKLSEEEIKKLMSAAILSPTSFNVQHWRFVIVEDPETRKKIREASWNQPQVTDASLLVVLCADVKAWEKKPERYWKNAPKEVQDYILPAIKSSYVGQDQFQREECIRSCSIAAQTLMIAAKAMGYDSNPMIGFQPEKVGKIINLPKDHMVCLMVVVGKAIKQAPPRSGQLPLDEVLFKDHF